MNNKTPEENSSDQTKVNIGDDVSDSIIIAGNGNVIHVGDGKSAKKPRRKSKPKTQKVNWSNPTIIVAVIGAIATITVGLLNSPLITDRPDQTDTPTATETIPPTDAATATEDFTSTPIVIVVTSTEVPPTASPTFTITPTATDTATASFTPEPKTDQMTAILQSSLDGGKSPLSINFDARTSYVKFADGSTMPCGTTSFCSYAFTVYRDSKYYDKADNNTGVLSYTFGAKGKYSVTVYVCRGKACSDDGVTVDVR